MLSRPILKAMIGNEAVDPLVFSAALKYVRIRALGMPAAAIIGSSQAACLGMQDIKSPLYVLFAAAVVNFLGDVCFVGNPHPWIGGAAGAAWATIISQYAAVEFFLRWLCKSTGERSKNNRFPPFFRRRTEKQQLPTNKYSTTIPTRGFLKGQFSGRDFFRLPTRDEIKDFSPYILPVTSTQVGRVSSYVVMSHVISSSLGTVNMAAQQVIISIWNCLYPVGESLSLTAQSFVPSIVETSGVNAQAVLRKTLQIFYKTSMIFGAALVCAVACIPLLGSFFTSDPIVMSFVNSVLPFLFLIFSTLGLFTSSEGFLLGQRDLGFLGKSYTSFFFVVPYFMLQVKRAALRGATTVNLRSVWKIFCTYQLFRTIVWVLRALQLQRRATSSETPKQ